MSPSVRVIYARGKGGFMLNLSDNKKHLDFISKNLCVLWKRNKTIKDLETEIKVLQSFIYTINNSESLSFREAAFLVFLIYKRATVEWIQKNFAKN